MNSTMKGALRATAAAGAAAACLASGMAYAQQIQEVKVQATRLMSTKSAGRTTSGIPILDVSLSYGVSTEGLDLATNSGATELEGRVRNAAAAACKEIGQRYPDATPSEAQCAKNATAKAMVKVHELVAAAEKAKQ
jgi:UrcA family protein